MSRDQVGEYLRLDVEARNHCHALTDNTGWIQLKDGTIVCTDKRGRPHAPITKIVRAEP